MPSANSPARVRRSTKMERGPANIKTDGRRCWPDTFVPAFYIGLPKWAAGLLLFVLMLAGSSLSVAAQSPQPASPDSSMATNSATLPLSLKRAVEIALAPDGNVRLRLAEELIQQAKARSGQARAALLPNVESSLSQQNQVRNLAALGLRIRLPIIGFKLPDLVGPFNTFDARATATQSLFDAGSIRRFQASRLNVEGAYAESDNAGDQVAAQVAKIYVTAVRAAAAMETAQANVALSEALVKLARDQKEAGSGTGIEVTRAKAQLANEKQRLLVAENERTRAGLELLRAIDLKLDVQLELLDKLAYIAVDPLSLEQAVATAVAARADLKAQKKREQSAEMIYRATRLERWPALYGFADYGSIGPSIHHAVPTRTYGFAVRVPVFDGGRREARGAELHSVLRQERLKTADLEKQVQLEIRLALDSLRSADAQVKVAEEGLALSEAELAQARRRYEAGIAISLEIVDAQTRLARARDNRIAALFNYHRAHIDLAQAMGTIRLMLQ
ncbi:MAG: TolC family protein [Acidobacteria bacterium]|nr:TolC family protein [Acidobacteriota bacterium]MBI3654820.1 TolC family protein [Acidobacteriota bacterium]